MVFFLGWYFGGNRTQQRIYQNIGDYLGDRTIYNEMTDIWRAKENKEKARLAQHQPKDPSKLTFDDFRYLHGREAESRNRDQGFFEQFSKEPALLAGMKLQTLLTRRATHQRKMEELRDQLLKVD